MQPNYFDSHVHSDHSFDAHHSVTFLCETAVERGLTGLCITDHCEMREYVSEDYARRIEQSVFDVEKAAHVFNGRLSVTAGIELSDVLHDEALTESVLRSHPFDMVLLSQHNTTEGEDIYYSDFTQWTFHEIDQYLESYFSYLVRAAQWNRHDVLAHLTYPLRYITGKHSIPVELGRYSDQIDTILKITAQNGKGIEINTSGLGKALGDVMPPYSIVRRFRELGGEYVTLGSDAHGAERLGSGLSDAARGLIEAGFTQVTFYKERHPLLFPIECLDGGCEHEGN